MHDLMFSRRLFLNRGVQLLSAASTLPLFLSRSAEVMAADFAANPQGAGRPDDRVLVVVQLAGGNDGLNTVIPYTNDNYYRARRTLAVKKDDALRLTDDYGLHPSCAGFKKLYEAGQLAILHSVGYPNQNRSHFRGTDIWATAEPDRFGRSGWLGRYFDNCCNGADPAPANGDAKPADAKAKEAKAADPSAAIALVGEPPMSLTGDRYIPLTFRNPSELSYGGATRDERIKTAFEKLNDLGEGRMAEESANENGTIRIPRGKDTPKMEVRPETGALDQGGEANEFIQRSALNARVYAETIKRTSANVRNKANYPRSNFAQQLKLTAQMIAGGLPTRVYYVSLGGFDTHSGQAFRHQRLMEEMSSGLAAFVEDLQALGQLDRTTVMTFSEFGRRVAENGSAGTDHGEAAPLFVMGSGIKPGFHGAGPALEPGKLSRGDVAFSMDFRSVYATVLKHWLKADDARVLGRTFAPIDLFTDAKKA